MADEFRLATTKQIMSKFYGNPIAVMTLQKYPLFLQQVIRNLKNVSENVSYEIATAHNIKTRKILFSSRIRSKARAVLMGHLDIVDERGRTRKLVSLSKVGALFEFGVREHEVYPNMISASGKLVGDWMEKQGLDRTAFTVGTPGSVLDKNKPIAFMKKGFEKAWSDAPKKTDFYLNKI